AQPVHPRGRLAPTRRCQVCHVTLWGVYEAQTLLALVCLVPWIRRLQLASDGTTARDPCAALMRLRRVALESCSRKANACGGCTYLRFFVRSSYADNSAERIPAVPAMTTRIFVAYGFGRDRDAWIPQMVL